MTTTNSTSTFKSEDDSLYKRPLRIADILSFPDEQHDVVSNSPFMDDDSILHHPNSATTTTLHCTSPYTILSKLLSAFKRHHSRRRNKKHLINPTLHHHQDLTPPNDLPLHHVFEGGGGGGFDIGVGCGVLYAVAATKHEMAQLASQMDNLLQTTQHQLHSLHNSLQLQSSPQTTLSYNLSHHHFKGQQHQQECVDDGIDRLEAELQSELQRLQSHLDGENMHRNHSSDTLSITEGVEETASKSYEASSGEVIDPAIDPEFEVMDLQYAVSPYELEKRLHELLESRQQQQIQELEAGLEYLKSKLLEKEFEVSWWKDTARLISRHAAESSRISSHRDRNSCISR